MKALGLLLAAIFALGSAFAEVVIVEEIIAKVNGDIILRSDYDEFVRDIRDEVKRSQDIPDDQKQKVVEQRESSVLRDLIDQRLLVQKGKELNINVEGQVLRQRDDIMKRYELETIDDFDDWVIDNTGMPVEDLMDQMRENFLSQAVLGQQVGARITVTREEVETYYDEHKDEFIRQEGVRLSEILISTQGKTGDELVEAEQRAKEVLGRVQKGEPFAEMARRYSDSEGSKAVGGSIGIFRRGDLLKEIEEQVFAKNPGDITDMIESRNGHLILKIDQKYREGLAELEEVEEEIRNRLSMPKYQPAVRVYLTSLREISYIEIRPGYLDASAAPGQDTSWSDPAKLAPVTTTREELLKKKKKRKLLWLIPLPGGGGDKDKKDDKDN